ncbi:hypothetical protein TrRE_jg2828 [Triparma retinervis]|uniref:Uncharacterized protein n=1 Tax=Triparma retinervis TaxID=2557542 RepID=A0A9W7CII0_9STRA|nr:hypothetical protein TrRE_jg2828 [Triparma retinervis]
MYDLLYSSLLSENTPLSKSLYLAPESLCIQAFKSSSKRRGSVVGRMKKLVGRKERPWKGFTSQDPTLQDEDGGMVKGEGGKGWGEVGYMEGRLGPSEPMVKPRGKEGKGKGKGNETFDMFMSVIFNTPLSPSSISRSPTLSPSSDPNMSTVLHQACRLVDFDFVKILLDKGGLPDFRDGRNRTALHMAVGGMSQEELALRGVGGDNNDNINYNHQNRDRSDSMGSRNSNDGGGGGRRRSSLLKKLFKSSAILTIIEEEGQNTPAELASAAGHEELRAWLEAVAIYEDEGLLAFGEGEGERHGGGDQGKRKIAPYKWFDNLRTEGVDKERCRRVSEALTAISNTPANNVPIDKLRLDQPQAIANYIPNTFSREKVIMMLNAVGWDTAMLIDRFTTNPRKFLRQVNQMPAEEEIREEAELCRARIAADKTSAASEEDQKQERALLGTPEIADRKAPEATEEYECAICMDDFKSGSDEVRRDKKG